ncbi:MAG: tetratricopeptide (TPR) repeat protein [Salibacteraceae bacterium]|jgi:tetratricopeptide (TPR) repeat protein
MDQSRLDLITGMHLKSPKDSYLAFAAAVENQLAGNQEKAIDIIEQLIVHDPEYSEAYYKLGKMYENANKTKKAVSIYHAGKKVATKNKDEKSLGEITEALMFLDEEEGNW